MIRSDDDTITIDEIRKTGHCVRGIRDWFKSYGYDFRDVVKNGVSAKDILSHNDAIGNKVVSDVRAKRAERGE